MATVPPVIRLSNGNQITMRGGAPRFRQAPAAPSVSYYPVTVAQVHSGHSLTDTAMFQGTWPFHGKYLLNSISAGAGNNLTGSTQPGSPMKWRRENPGTPDAFGSIGDYELLVVTENNANWPESLFPNPGWETDGRNQRREELRIWLDNAWTNGNGGAGTPLIYYTCWPAHGDFAPAASWRARLEADEVEWLARVTYAEANKTTSAPTIRVVPGNAMMMRLWDDAEAGNIPGIADGAAFLASAGWWADTVHPAGYGDLLMAYLHIYTIHGVDPATLPYTGMGLTHEPDATLHAYMASVVKDVVDNYARALV